VLPLLADPQPGRAQASLDTEPQGYGEVEALESSVDPARATGEERAPRLRTEPEPALGEVLASCDRNGPLWRARRCEFSPLAGRTP
jgi:hypothetical protein